MIITILVVSVVVVSIVAIGVPCAWFLQGRKSLGEHEWIVAPFLGIAVIILVLQNLVYLDLPLRYTTPLLWVGTLAAWIWMYRSGHLPVLFTSAPRALYAVGSAVYLLQGIGLFLVGAQFYMGRAWGDQFNYTVLTQFLADYRFSTSLEQIGNQPYLVNAITLKHDRIGETILQGFFAISSFQEAKTLFEPTILLCPALLVFAVYALGRRFALPRSYALAIAAVAALLPAVAAVHLESFLSQALAMPFLLLFPLLLDRLIEQADWQRLFAAALMIAAITSIYTEFWIILNGLSLLVFCVAAARRPWPWRLLGCWCGLVLAPFILNPFFTPTVLQILTRVDEPVLSNIYPWALTIEGICRIWLGDLAVMWAFFQSASRFYALAATMLGYYGLMHMCFGRFFTTRMGWNDVEQRRTLAFAIAVLALALLPVLVIIRDSDHPYQFYKLLLSMSPLLVLGVGLAFQPYFLSDARVVRAAALPARPSLLAICGLSLLLVGSLAGTTAMTLASISLQPDERYTGDLLLAPDMRELEAQLATLQDKKLFFYQADRTWDTGFLNAWLTYFARDNQIWLGNPHLNGTDLNAVPQAEPILDLATLPPDILILTDVPRELAAAQSDQLLWSNATYQIWQAHGAAWTALLAIDNTYGLEQFDGLPFFWMGRDDTTIQLLASQAGVLRMSAAFLMGPSLPGTSERALLVSTDAGYSQKVTITANDNIILAPIKAGLNKITLRVLNKPSISQQPNGDTRALMLGVKGLGIGLDNSSALIQTIDNPNGMETSDGKPFFWLGQSEAVVKIVTTQAGRLSMRATFFLGPSAPELTERRVLITTDRGYRQTFLLEAGEQSIELPVEAGATTIAFHALDRPSVAVQPNGDPRTLLLGIQGLTAELK